MTTEPRSLHRKLAQVMYEAERIPKNGTAPAVMGGYKFVQVGDAADFIRKALAEKVITMMPTKVTVVGQVDRPTLKGGTMTTVDLVTEWTLTDGESGESITIESFGAGADGGDKYSGKASTSAMKYALLTGFLLSTGEDSELGTAEAGQRPRVATVNGGSPPEHPPVIPPNVETEALIGSFKRATATVRRRDSKTPIEARETPDGHAIVLRLEMGSDKAIPQVVIAGPAGEALFLATSMKPDSLVGQNLSVKGMLFHVTKPGAKPYNRLHVSEWATVDYQYPAPDEDPGPPPPDDVRLVGEKPEAETAPLFDELPI
jgi:hypothetical protein